MGVHNLAQIINKGDEIVVEPEEPADEDHIVRGED